MEFWRCSWRRTGKTVTGPVPMACVACGREGGRRVAWGVVLGCGFCAAVGVFMAYKFNIMICLWVGLLSLGSMG